MANTARDVIEMIGEPESGRVQFVLERLPRAAKTTNCAVAALYLQGVPEKYVTNFFQFPMEGLWANESKLVFFRSGWDGYDLIGSAEMRDLKKREGYAVDVEKSGYVFYMNLGGNKVLTPENLYELSKIGNRYSNLIINPFGPREGMKKLWRELNIVLNHEKVVSLLSYKYGNGIHFDTFHHRTLLKNRGKCFVIEKWPKGEFSGKPIDESNFLKVINPYKSGLHFFAVGGEEMP